MNENVDPQQDFTDQALRIIHEAEKQGVVLRLMGAIAVRLHCPNFANLHREMGRVITDIDFVGYEKQTQKIEKVLESLDYVGRPMSYSFIMLGRLIFTHKTSGRHVDVFLNKLAMCHTIDYSKRLELDNPTVPLAELLLQKMQIVQLSEKDVIDTMIMFLEHDMGDGDENTINIEYIASLMSKDWGFYYTMTTNLNKVKNLVGEFPALSEQQRQIVVGKADQILASLEAAPKSRSWKLRARIGPSKKWYKDIYSAPK